MKPDIRPFDASCANLFKEYGIDAAHLTEAVGINISKKLVRAWNEDGVCWDSDRLSHMREILDEWKAGVRRGGVVKNPNIHNFPDGAEARTIKPKIAEIVFTKDALAAAIGAVFSYDVGASVIDTAADAAWEYITDNLLVQSKATEIVISRGDGKKSKNLDMTVTYSI